MESDRPLALRAGKRREQPHVEGITWHALTLQADKFDATKKLLMEVFGLRPAIDTDGYTRFPMSNGTILELCAPEAIPAYGFNDGGIAFGSGWRTSKRPQRNWLRPDASSWGRSLASRRRTTPIGTSGAPTDASTGSTSRSRSGSRSSPTLRPAFGVGWSWSPVPSELGYAELRVHGVLRRSR